MKIERINKWFERLASGIIKKRWLVIIIFFTLIAISIIGLRKVVV